MLEWTGERKEDYMNIKELIEKEESETLEFKERFNKETIETAVAFSNSSGGIILIGGSGRGEVKGASVGKETLNEWINKMSQSTEPAIIPEIEEYAMEGKTVVAITIKQSPLKPTAYKGICFLRIENSNKKLTPKDVSELYLQTIGSSWDAYSSREVKIEDIDYKKVGFYIKLANETGRRKITEEPLEVLKKLELIKDKGKLTNKDYQDLFFVSKQTATRDLSHLVDLNILQKIGQTGKGTYYVLASKGS